MTDWLQLIINLKVEKMKEFDFKSANDYLTIEKWLKFNHPIEEIFQNRDSYNEVVKKELLKLERRKKIEKINERR